MRRQAQGAQGQPGIPNAPLAASDLPRTLQSGLPRLLVFDNCEEEALLETWRPTSGGCRVLVTSRRSHWSPTLGVTALPLDLLEILSRPVDGWVSGGLLRG